MNILIKEILTSPAGSFGFVFALFCLIFYIVFKAGKLVEKFTVIDTMQNNIDKIKEDIQTIKASVSVFNDFLISFNQSKNPFAQSQSPISLTLLGKNVYNDLSIQSIVDSNWNAFDDEIKFNLHQNVNPYDIQQVCFLIGRDFSKYLKEEDLNRIKKYAFIKGFNIMDFDLIFGIVLRDKFFKEENINLEDVDIYDPNKK